MGVARIQTILEVIWSIARPYVIGTIAVVAVYAIAAALYAR